EPEIFDIINDLKPGANNEYQFTDALDIISRQRGGYALEFEGTRYDMGDRLGFLKANVEFGLRDEGLSEQFKEYLLNLFNN
ncbi:MAG: UTP--glucose-1-phosphate uridylyltransferase, partial [Clostridia bacterium]|nr:UTP--glucose-1-phosphate uridylyltransferase [Clostridia bacterium]